MSAHNKRSKAASRNSEIEQIAIELRHVAAELAVTKDLFLAIVRNLYGESMAEYGKALVENQVDCVDQIVERLQALRLESDAEFELRSRRRHRVSSAARRKQSFDTDNRPSASKTDSTSQVHPGHWFAWR